MTTTDRPVQRFSREYLEQTAATPPGEIARFLDDFRRLHASRSTAPPSRPLSLRVPVPLPAFASERWRRPARPR